MDMRSHDAGLQALPASVFSVTVDALTRDIYKTATPAMRARMKAQACARVSTVLTPEERSRLLALLRQPDRAALAEIQRDEPEWAGAGVGAALLWMVGTDLRLDG